MGRDDLGMGWIERARGAAGPIYLALADALEAAVRGGELQPGDRLPPQRTVAERLGVDFTTVTRAYGLARERGLLEGAVGRGSFVRARTDDDEVGLVDLSMNLPPPPDGVSLAELLAETTGSILRRADVATLMAYHPGAGTASQRAAGAAWCAPVIGDVPPERMLVAAGAQAALAATLATLCRQGDAVACEPLIYPGLKTSARQLGLHLVPCAADSEGPEPDAFEALCRAGPPAAVYLTPAMQNPTATTMGEARRRRIVEIAERHGVWIIEDDPYSRLLDAPSPALAALAPERTVHIATTAKTLSPGLRIAFVAAPEAVAGRLAEGLRGFSLMASPLAAAVLTRWIREGQAEAILAGVRAEARARRALAAEILPQAVGEATSLHVWASAPSGLGGERLRAAAAARGLSLMPAEAFAVGDAWPNGLRISLGAPRSRAVLGKALTATAALLREAA
ncbi:MAG: PLP-dependent aminotransferase family protein [Caulobacterales bacterium]|nr:PLP-dependent aminotransferase family protein [Caulobacterales bacterium]